MAIDPHRGPCYTARAHTQIPMGLREDSLTIRDDLPQATPEGTRKAAPYAARTRDYYRSLSASTVGLEMAVSVLLGLFAGRWLDGKAGTAPWLMILGLTLGFAAGLRSVMRFVRLADRDAERAEAEAARVTAAAERTAATGTNAAAGAAGERAP
jgi:F0F1-type ATP synthase assembly protein I